MSLFLFLILWTVVLSHCAYYATLIAARRTLLSEAYSCEETWKERLELPILKKVDIGGYSCASEGCNVTCLWDKLLAMQSVRQSFGLWAVSFFMNPCWPVPLSQVSLCPGLSVAKCNICSVVCVCVLSRFLVYCSVEYIVSTVSTYYNISCLSFNFNAHWQW